LFVALSFSIQEKAFIMRFNFYFCILYIYFFPTRCNCPSGPGPRHYRRFTIILS